MLGLVWLCVMYCSRGIFWIGLGFVSYIVYTVEVSVLCFFSQSLFVEDLQTKVPCYLIDSFELVFPLNLYLKSCTQAPSTSGRRALPGLARR